MVNNRPLPPPAVPPLPNKVGTLPSGRVYKSLDLQGLPRLIYALEQGDVDCIDTAASYNVLLQAIQTYESKYGDLTEQTVRAIDIAYQARLIDLAQPGTTIEQAKSFANHLYSVAHDSRKQHLDSMTLCYYSRWRGYADVAVMIMRLLQQTSAQKRT